MPLGARGDCGNAFAFIRLEYPRNERGSFLLCKNQPVPFVI